MKFTKMQGAGNDYIYFDCLRAPFPADPEETSRRLSDRHFGIGGDGIVLILPSGTADFRMRIFNADGSEAPMCGNASRCVGRFVYEKGYTDRREIALETASGIKNITVRGDRGGELSVGVDIGRASFDPADVPAVLPCPPGDFSVETPFGRAKAVAVSVGTAHCVIFTDHIADFPLEQTAKDLVARGLFPRGVNTEIVRVLPGTGLEARVYERGSGETLACGTGASASVAAAVLLGFFPQGVPVPVNMPGGTVTATVLDRGFHIRMEGPTAFVFEGEIAL